MNQKSLVENTGMVEVAPYWNVNMLLLKHSFLFLLVEVAPYWNVNLEEQMKFKIPYIVEVAPYWNVNLGSDNGTDCSGLCRSSSILECKFRNV